MEGLEESPGYLVGCNLLHKCWYFEVFVLLVVVVVVVVVVASGSGNEGGVEDGDDDSLFYSLNFRALVT